MPPGGGRKFWFSDNIPDPLTESLDALSDGGCTEKENETGKFCYQQDNELSPVLAVGGVDAAAEDVEHQRRDHIAGQGQQPFCHQSQKHHKERNRKKTIFFSVNIILNTNLSFQLYYKGINDCVARMSSVICSISSCIVTTSCAENRLNGHVPPGAYSQPFLHHSELIHPEPE